MPDLSDRLIEYVKRAEDEMKPVFERIDDISFRNTERVLQAFRYHKVSEASFAPTTGYGYTDPGRDRLEQIYAHVFGAEAALVRMQIVSGTHALTIALFGILRPRDVMLSVAGRPYDTLEQVIGLSGTAGNGSLKDFGITYDEVELNASGRLDYEAIARAMDKAGNNLKMVFVQRSKGYLNRRTLTVQEIGELADFVHRRAPGTFVVVDNCYGEFTEDREPTSVGADLCVGSLIKNPGGGMAETGAYLAGSARAVELVSYRYSSPGTGAEAGATLGQNKNMYKGLFYAPHTVAQALKTAHLAAYLFEKLGCEVEPRWDETRSDIIQTVRTLSKERMCALCEGIQSASPVDAYVTPIPVPMPGYADEVIMAAGAFTSGSSIELSADGPIRPPYTVYLQGGLTYESGKIGIMAAARMMIDRGLLELKESTTHHLNPDGF